MGEYEDMISAILARRPKMAREELEEMVAEKLDIAGSGSLTEEGAVHLVASDLDITLRDEEGNARAGVEICAGERHEGAEGAAELDLGAGALVERAKELGAQGMHKEALDAFERAAKLDPDDADAHAGLAGELAALFRHEEALDAYDRALKLYSSHSSIFSAGSPHPKVAPTQVGRGATLWSLGRHEDAVNSYGKAIGTYEKTIRPSKENDKSPAGPIQGHAEAHHKRALALLKLNRFGSAVADCERAIEISPDYVPAHRALVPALLEFRRSDERPLDQLLAATDRAIGVDPGHAPTHAARGSAICELGCYAYALAEYDRAVGLDPGCAEAHHGRGTALAEMGRHDEALEAFGRALEIDPALPGVSLDKSRSLSALGRHGEALDACDLALTARPNTYVAQGLRKSEPTGQDSPQFHAARGLALNGLGRRDEADSALKRASDLGLMYGIMPVLPVTASADPGSRDGDLAPYDTASFGEDDPVAHRSHAMTLQSLGRHHMALTAYNRAIKIDPGHAMAYCDRASVLLSLERPADALASLDRAAELEPDNAMLHARRAGALSKLGLHAESKEAWAWAKSLVHAQERA